MRTYSGDDLRKLAFVLELHGRLPAGFLATLDDDDLTIRYQETVLCYGITGLVQVPCELQLKVVLSDCHGKNTLVSTLCHSGQTLTLSPLKCLKLQVT